MSGFASEDLVAARQEKEAISRDLVTVLIAKNELEEQEREAQHASKRSASESRLAARRAARSAGKSEAAAAEGSQTLPSGLMEICGAEDSAWLAREAAAAAARLADYGSVDGVEALMAAGDEDDDDGGLGRGPCAGDAWAEWAMLFDLSDARAWENTPLVFHTSQHASGHGDVVWASGEYLAARLLAHGSIFDVAVGGLRVLELGAGTGLPSLAAVRAGADVVVTDNETPGAIFALAASARWAAAAADDGGGAICVRSLAWGAPAREGPFDVVLLADCIYDPESHAPLLATLASVFAERATATAVVAFALHGNADDAAVLAFFDKANAAGLHVTRVDEQQMRVSQSMWASSARDAKRSLVHAYFLTAVPRDPPALPPPPEQPPTAAAPAAAASESGC